MRYFLLGSDGIKAFEKKDFRFLVDFKDRWELIGHDPSAHDITELLEHVIGWDSYLELLESDVNEVNNAIEAIERQERDFNKFFHAYMKQQISNDFERSLGLSF